MPSRMEERLLLGNKLPRSLMLQQQQRKFSEYGPKRRKRFLQYSQLLTAFVLGFLLALASFLFYDHYFPWSMRLERVSKSVPEKSSSITGHHHVGENSVHEFLFENVRVLCMVLTCPKYHRERAVHIKATWGKRCHRLIFVSSADDAELPAIAVVHEHEDVYEHLWNKTRQGFKYLYENYLNDYDWFLKADDDTYVVMENLRYMLYAYEPSTPIYFGYELQLHNISYLSGGASYVLSQEALRRYGDKAFPNHKLCPKDENMKGEDFNMGRCLHSVDIIVGDSRRALPGVDDKNKFFPLTIAAFTEPNNRNETIPDWLVEMTPTNVESGSGCCSNYSVAFHYVMPKLLYEYEFFIYHLQTFAMDRLANKILPNKLSYQEVAKLFNSSQVTADYYEYY